MDWNNLLKPAKKVPDTSWSSPDPMSLKPKVSTLTILIIGLWIFGTGDAIIVAAGLGVAPWTVLAQGIAQQINWTLGQTTFLVSIIVLFLWIPIKERPGVGTILNAILIALAIDVMMPYLPNPDLYIFQIIQVLIGTLFVGIGSGLYLTANLGPGPRDGWMTGIQKITNIPIAKVRASIEIIVLFLGYYLGGTLGIGTIIFALLIGHIVAISLQLTGRFGGN
ncbi:MAG: hypothetical protein CND89_02485 [Marine Group II euryarchaeote MED-G38]|nr:hypothetical protein [Euryarchaeota archaeon]PDH23271.1 MAG: hypothetical protein CND89_02485 [Marine Group II euryarchaeote MED-G38]|tara:strand:- start:6826 stop:7491 length:666 start_codon:yes stop_codon:yes gene_type:complete